MKSKNISRESVRKIKNKIKPLTENGLEEMIQFSYELSKGIARAYKGPILRSTPTDIQLSEDEIKTICLDFYRKFDVDAYKHVKSILDETNRDFKNIFYDPNIKKEYPNSP